MRLLLFTSRSRAGMRIRALPRRVSGGCTSLALLLWKLSSAGRSGGVACSSGDSESGVAGNCPVTTFLIFLATFLPNLPSTIFSLLLLLS